MMLTVRPIIDANAWPLGEKNYWAQLLSFNMVRLYSHAVLMMH